MKIIKGKIKWYKCKYAVKANIQKINHVERLKGKNRKFIYIHSK